LRSICKRVGEERILGVLDGIAVAKDSDRKLRVIGIRFHLVVAAHGNIHGDQSLSCGVEEIERLAPNGPMASATTTAASGCRSRLNQADSRQCEQCYKRFPHHASFIGTISFPRNPTLFAEELFGNRSTFEVN
jgi:hypothetical protein